MSTTLQPDATGWVPTYFDGFDGGWMQFYTTWGNRYGGAHANGAYSYNPDLVSIDNSMLTVTNARTANGWEAGGVDQGFIGQRYGKYEIRARVEDGQGTSGAIILWPNSGRWPPEIDIMESPSADRSSVWFFYHGLEGTGGGQFDIDASDWHTYTLEWMPGKITWSVDGQLLAETKEWESSWVPDEPMTLSFTGFVASPSDTWWGVPNETTPERVNMYVDYVNISALPLGTRDQLAPTLFDGGAAPATVTVGPAAISGQLYAAAINTGEWGTVGTAQAAPASWGATLADRMAWVGFNQVHLDLRSAGGEPLDIMLLDAKGGSVSTGSGNDVVAWVAMSDVAGAGNTLTLNTGAGHDAVRVGPAGWIGLDDPYLHTTTLDPWYEGENSIATGTLGEGNDMLLAVGLVKLWVDGGQGADLMHGGAGDDTLEGGAGDDTLQGGFGTDYAVYAGPRDRFTVTASEWGVTTVTDNTGALGTDKLSEMERITFQDVTIDLASGTSVTGPTPPPTTDPAPPPPADQPPPPTTGSTTLGSGPDALVLRISQDAWQGSAQYSVSVNGVAIGGTLTAVALRGTGQDTVTLLGDWGSGPHTVSVNFLNDAWGGTADTDRNLYVEGVSYNGAAVPNGTSALLITGPVEIGFGGTAAPVAEPPPAVGSTTLGSGPDALVLRISQDAWQGSADYTVSVDGVQIGGVLTAVAAHGAAQDTVTLLGNWGSGPHSVSVNFLNDAWGGTADTDRNLYVEGVSYNGAAVAGGTAALMGAGPVGFGFGASAPPPAGLPQPANGGMLVQGTDAVDQLAGTQGDDVILGARGNDGLVGGWGADSFVFRAGDGPDWVDDFASGEDRLVFQGLTREAVSWHGQSYFGLPGIEVAYGTDTVFLSGAWELRESDLAFA